MKSYDFQSYEQRPFIEARPERKDDDSLYEIDHGIVALTGPNGAGKSMVGVNIAYPQTQKPCRGEKCGDPSCEKLTICYTSDGSMVAAGWAKPIDEIIPYVVSGMNDHPKTKHMMLFLDEGHLFMDNRSSMTRENRIMNGFIRQIRKFNCIALLTTPSLDSIDRVPASLTKLTVNVWNPRKNNRFIKALVRPLSLGHIDPRLRSKIPDKEMTFDCGKTRHLYVSESTVSPPVIDILRKEIYLRSKHGGRHSTYKYEDVAILAVAELVDEGKAEVEAKEVGNMVRAQYTDLPPRFDEDLEAIMACCMTFNKAVYQNPEGKWVLTGGGSAPSGGDPNLEHEDDDEGTDEEETDKED